MFSQKGNLKTHTHRAHENHKNYKCDYCGKSFSHAGYLKRHIQIIHDAPKEKKTAKTLNTCESCGNSFSRASSLKRHIHTVHETNKNPTKNVLIANPKIIKEEFIKIEEVMPEPINNSKTRVELTINGNKDNVHWIKVAKPSNFITLNDIKPLLMRKPKMYGMSNEMEYYYLAKAINDGKAGFEHIDEDDSILPLFGGKIELQCWSR